jgi:1,4-alpha-glucan branching enzyme
MFIRRIVTKSSCALLLAASFLAGCKKDSPTPPGPVDPPMVTTTPPQYGTPFAGVPNREDAVMYQVNMRAFSQAGNFAGVTARLDSIKAIGVNVLYLMPIYPVGQATGTKPAFNSPYAVKDYRAVNAEFGNLNDLRTLVDAAHARGMSVMLDWVANHTSWDNPWITQHPDWYIRDAAGAITSVINPNDGTRYNDVAQLDFSNSLMRAEMISALKSWVFTANVDGFRFDYADFQPNDFWRQATDTLRAVRTHKLLLLAEGTRASNFTSGFDYNFGFGFYGGIYQVYRSNQPATNFDGLNTSEFNGATGTQGVVRYITNHDVNGSDGTPVTLFGGHPGAMSAFVITALYKGVPLIYNGQEAGMTRAITFPFIGPTIPKVDWNANRATTLAYKQLMTARAASAALRKGTPTAYSTANVCAFTKVSGSEQAFVMVNVRNSANTYTVPAALANTTWTNALTGSPVTLGTQVTLPPYGYTVLKR